MRIGAFMLAVIWGLSMVQPSFAYFGGKSAYSYCTATITAKPPCSKTKPSDSACSKEKPGNPDCSRKKCSKPAKSEENDDCKSEQCNPTLGCSAGNFYVHTNHQFTLPSRFEKRPKPVVTNDNCIAHNLSECWQPPEA